MRDAGQAHRLHRVRIQLHAAAQHDRLKQSGLIAEELLRPRAERLPRQSERLDDRKAPLARRAPPGQEIAGELVAAAQRRDAPVHPAGIAHALLLKQPSRAADRLAHGHRARALTLFEHERHHRAAGQACFPLHRHIRETHARVGELAHDGPRQRDAGLRRRIADRQHPRRTPVTDQQHQRQNAEKRAPSAGPAQEAQPGKERAKHKDDRHGRTEYAGQPNARQICGAGCGELASAGFKAPVPPHAHPPFGFSV